ncbi:hypothetical protein THTE_0361 [Thermogutta terrifontis]|uniref:Uncharacterized protein n=1 Tax=Thermogutta terrifontis TaxID=1331910 RepID=A0A286RAK1_9BACT|nr:hypothetical protein THTE_0361 [Thermogutta terrifontis]
MALMNVFSGRFMNRPYRKWRDPLVGSDEHRLTTHPSSSGTTGVPLRPFGGTRLSGPPFNVGSSIPFHRGLKSRAESGAKAPHSIFEAGHDRRAPPEKSPWQIIPLRHGIFQDK